MTSGHGSKLGMRKEAAIAALMNSRTVGEAARVAGLGDKTLRRWMASEPEFQSAYRDARGEALRAGVERLTALLSRAAETLERNMTCGVPAVEVRAAGAVFALALRGAEFVDLVERVAELEASNCAGTASLTADTSRSSG